MDLVSDKPKKKEAKKLSRPFQMYPLVEIHWDDATGLRHGWESDVDSIELAIVLSVGFLIKETESHIIIAQDLSPEGEHNGRSQIPKGMIKATKILRKADNVKSTPV